MTPLTLAGRYMKIFFSGKHLEALSEILAEDLNFCGPFYRFDSARDYIESLKSDPPTDCHYKMIREFEDRASACLIYEFHKPGIRIPMAHLFETKNGKIHKMTLVFDTAGFSTPGEKE